ncbi:asparagine synthase (glutamine-hydrolyzing) [Bacteroidota bacterium]
MCGINGFLSFRGKADPNCLSLMNAALVHRGPDDSGTWQQETNTLHIGLAQVRLSIIDTSALGHQPMHFENLSLVFNGEVYNYREIQAELLEKGYSFQSGSDTEVVLKAYHCWGIKAVERFIGMFALALYDSLTGALVLVRDRLGIKPLYWTLHKGIFYFASEIKALLTLEGDFTLHTPALRNYLRYGYVQGDKTLLSGIYKLKPGNWLEINISGIPRINTYWDLRTCYTRPLYTGTYEEALEETAALLESACAYRTIADVPVGIFLSGGFDSSLVTAMLQRNSTQPLRTFTIGFPDGVNEAPAARQIATHLGTQHTSFDCTLQEAMDLIPALPFYYDEPIGDISCIPTMLVSRLASKQVKVALSADGGDELFAGYTSYRQTLRRMQVLKKIPIPVLTGPGLNLLGDLLETYQPYRAKKMKGIGASLASSESKAWWELSRNGKGIPAGIINQLLSGTETELGIPELGNLELSDPRNALLLQDIESSLSDYLLIKVDRASMAFGLEAREPLLDHRLLEWSAKLPFDYKEDGQTSKRLLRDLTYRYLPKQLMDRPKTGFDLPVFTWLRGSLKSWLLDELNDAQFYQTTGIPQKKAKDLVNAFLAGENRLQDLVWRLLILKLWCSKWKICK